MTLIKRLLTNQIVITLLILIAFAGNVLAAYRYFYPVDYALSTRNSRLNVLMPRQRYIEISYPNDYLEEKAGGIIQLFPTDTKVNYQENNDQDFWSAEISKINETVTSSSVKIDSTITKLSSSSFTLTRRYTFSDVTMLQDAANVVMPIVAIGDEYKYAGTTKTLISSQCQISFDQTSNTVRAKLVFDPSSNILYVVTPVNSDVLLTGEATINVQINFACSNK